MSGSSAESYFALAGLLTLAALLLLGLMRATGERMRERSAQLLTMGFPLRWSASVAALQLGMAVTGGLTARVLGSVSAVVTRDDGRQHSCGRPDCTVRRHRIL